MIKARAPAGSSSHARHPSLNQKYLLCGSSCTNISQSVFSCFSSRIFSAVQTMSTRLDGGVGRKGREAFHSAHRCPEVDLLPRHNSEPAIHPPGSLFVPPKKPEFTCTGQSEANYLEVSSTPCRDEEGEEDETISDWSEEDLSLHFSPSVILPSDDEESDSEATFECVDIIIETLVSCFY